MQITVRDDAPELGTDVTSVGDGWVKAHADDLRIAELTSFLRVNPGVITGGGFGARFGRGTAKDAVEAESFAINQLAYLEAKAQTRWYQPMMFEEIMPGCIDFSAGSHATSVDYLISDQVGIGRLISPAANDIPMVDVAYAKVSIPVASGGIGYDYTQDDLRKSAYLRQPLSSTKQVAAMLAYKRHMNKVALIGETPSNFTGLYKNATATAANRTSGAVWDSATADTIVSDIIAAYAAYVSATKDNLRPSHIGFPITSFMLLLKPRATTSDTTIKSFIEQTLNVTIFSDDLLETASAATGKRVVFFNPTNDNMVFHIPMPLQFLAPQLNGYRVIVPGEYKYAGFELRRVLSVRYMDAV